MFYLERLILFPIIFNVIKNLSHLPCIKQWNSLKQSHLPWYWEYSNTAFFGVLLVKLRQGQSSHCIQVDLHSMGKFSTIEKRVYLNTEEINRKLKREVCEEQQTSHDWQPTGARRQDRTSLLKPSQRINLANSLLLNLEFFWIIRE